MSLRVISGTAKGRKLKDVPGDTTRPVTDMVKEALFNILAGDVLDSAWWDLFAGTGAIGIEALSRGAAFVRFSDLNRLPIDTIQANLQTTGFSSQAEVRRGDAFSMLEAAPTRPFDYVYIAPPQYKEMAFEGAPAPGCQPRLAERRRRLGDRTDPPARVSQAGITVPGGVRTAQVWQHPAGLLREEIINESCHFPVMFVSMKRMVYYPGGAYEPEDCQN